MTNLIKRGSVVVFFLLFVCSSVAFAAPITPTMAEKVGSNFLKAQDGIQGSAFEKRDVQGYENHAIKTVGEIKSDGKRDILAYVFSLEPKGFVVVSPDTDITPIIAYSFEGNFDWENSPNNILLDMLKQDMQNRLGALSAVSQDLKDKNYELWENYFSEDSGLLNQMADGAEGAISGPLLSTNYTQSSPYNNYCPTDPSTGSTSIVGCVATAMAQVVNYHACTTSVTFTSADNYTTDTRGINVTASSANISSITYPASSDTAAKISFACGVSVEMDYTSSLSLAVTQHAAAALTTKFGFTSASPYAPSTYYSIPVLATFYTKLQTNMENGKPAILAIQKSDGSGGHAIVCDGYDSATGKFHLNFGWGSTIPTPPCWYTLPAGMPSGYSVVNYGVLDITSPCHPSCPDIYSWDGEEYHFAGSLFTRTHSPESEFYQSQIITPVMPQGDTLSFLIKEIDKEVSYINSMTMYYRYAWDTSGKWFSLPFLSAAHSRFGNVMEGLLEKDDKRVYMEPNDQILLKYALPPSGMLGAEFASVASGYYLWSHETWCEVLALGRQLYVEPGDTVTLRAYINNMSTKVLPDNTVVSFSLEDGADTPVGTVSAAGLIPGGSQWYSFTWTVPDNFTAGTYTYQASIFKGDSDITWKPEYYPTLH